MTTFGLGVALGAGIGVAGTIGLLLLLARYGDAEPGAEGQPVFECRACREFPIVGTEAGRKHATSHSAIDEKNWEDILMEVG